uniref:CSON008587 protein n=1 Tax=Culicoides sonorensis TaxID=179676 RepID=A0A336KEM6_CULSO
MRPCGRIVIKILELIGCGTCLVAKGVTDLEEGRIATRNQKLSREWSLLNNVTWDGSGNTFVNITFGGYLIITALMLIARCIDAKSRPHLLEKILILLGALMFFACAGLILASIDQILPELYDNAIILGVLSFIVGMLYLIDLADPLARKIQTTTQTAESGMSSDTTMQKQKLGQISSGVNTVDTMSPNAPVSGNDTWRKPLIISKDAQTTTDSLPATPTTVRVSRSNTVRQQVMPPFNNQYPPNSDVMMMMNEGMQEVDFVETKNYPQRQSPVFSKVKTSQERKPVKQKDIARNYINRGFLEQWEEEEPQVTTKPPSVSPSRLSQRTRSPDLYHSSTYIQAPPVDKGSLSVIRKSKPVLYTYYPEFSTSPEGQRDHHEDDDEQPPPMRRGYVATAAAIWDSRVSQKSINRTGHGSLRRAGSQDTNV